jgi:hypothetical protein
VITRDRLQTVLFLLANLAVDRAAILLGMTEREARAVRAAYTPFTKARLANATKAKAKTQTHTFQPQILKKSA